MRRNRAAALAALGSVALLAGCAGGEVETKQSEATEQSGSEASATENGGTRVIVDDLGREVEIPENVETIIPLGNAPRVSTYVECADKAVGVGGHRNPEDITPVTAYEYANKDVWEDLPIVGTDFKGETDYFPEEIVALGPDVIITSYGQDLVEDIEAKTGLPVIAVDAGSTGGPAANLFAPEYDHALRLVAEVCGTEDRADDLIAFMDENLSDLEERTKDISDDDKPTVLGAAASTRGFHGIDSVYVNYPVFDVIHANNPAEGISDQTGGVTVDKEQILAWNPEYIFLDSAGVSIVQEDYKENPEFYDQLQAVKNGHVYQHPSSTSLFSNVEIPIANAYYMGSILYPEQFEDVDFQTKANEIFKYFIGTDDHYGSLEEYGEGYTPVTLGSK